MHSQRLGIMVFFCLVVNALGQSTVVGPFGQVQPYRLSFSYLTYTDINPVWGPRVDRQYYLSRWVGLHTC